MDASPLNTATSLSARLTERFGRVLPASTITGFGEDCEAFAVWSGLLIRLGEKQERGERARGDARAETPVELADRIVNWLARDETARRNNRIALFLPAEEFLSTVVSLPGLPEAAAPSAINLQAQSLIPSLDEPLALVQNPSRIEGTDDYLCLWMRQARLDEYSASFEDAGLDLVAVAPRVLLMNQDTANTIRCEDEDREQLTCTILKNNKPIKWATLRRSDLDDDELRSQWQSEKTADELANAGVEIRHNGNEWLTTAAMKQAAVSALDSGYALLPAGEIKRRKEQRDRARYKFFAAVSAAIIFLAATPFLLQSLQFRLVANELDALRQETASARQDQALVAEFDRKWGPVNEYPQQDIGAIMFTLQRVISPDTVTNLEIDEGVIRIDGSSSNPQSILQRLEQDPMFTEVVFSRATNNSRYYIDLRLATVSFEGYRVRHLEERD